MSTDSEDQGFDEALKNFQLLIGPSPAASSSIGSTSNAAAAATTSTTTVGNPFQIEASPMENETIVRQIFGTHCQCGAERMVATTSKANQSSSSAGGGGSKAGGSSTSSSASRHSATSLEHGIINPTSFKHKSKGDRKLVIRESMLKNIGKCVHQNLVKHGSISKEGKQFPASDKAFLSAPAASSLKPSLSENNLTKCFNNEASDDILDFRLLVDQCSELTLSPTSAGAGSRVSTDPAPNYSQSSFKALRQPDFSSFQLSRSSTSGMSRRNRRARHLKRYNSTSSLESDSSSSGFVGTLGGPAGGSSSGTSNSTSSSQPNQSNSSQQQQSSPSASSASCSTQARLNDLMPCDITIDEMASYFETLVHIPKKMSSMAEMMYI